MSADMLTGPGCRLASDADLVAALRHAVSLLTFGPVLSGTIDAELVLDEVAARLDVRAGDFANLARSVAAELARADQMRRMVWAVYGGRGRLGLHATWEAVRRRFPGAPERPESTEPRRSTAWLEGPERQELCAQPEEVLP